jgi:hypothetical protein
MRTLGIEAIALRAIESAEQHRPNEDSRVELKAEWPDDPQRAARRIAGHANSSRGEPIIWVIGVDELAGVKGAAQNDLATWWPQIKAQFEGPIPALRDVLIHWKGATAVALCFETDQAPYLVKNPTYGKGGPVQFEVPWRDGTSTRTATHSDLILLLSPLQRPILCVELGADRRFVNGYPLVQGVKLPDTDGYASAAYFLRVRVVNRGRRVARTCAGYLTNVEVLRDGCFKETAYADDLQLTWSHCPGWPALDLLPEVPHWLDVISTLELPAFLPPDEPAN